MTPAQRKAAAAALAVALAAPAEGLRQYAYRDVTGLPTICLGSTRGVKMGDFRTVPECRALLDKEMLAAVDQVERCAPGLPSNVLAAFGDAVYNLGPVIACDPTRSTAARMLLAGDIAGACAQLPRWDKAQVLGQLISLPGLRKRRAAEQALCES